MRTLLRFSLFIAILVLLSLLGINITQAQPSGDKDYGNNPDYNNEASLPWFSQYVQQASYSNDVGTYLSLALRPFDDIPYISYYDAANGNLMLAHLVSRANGNCGRNNTWYCEILDSEGDVGTYSSLDFWTDESAHTWKIGISYHDETNRGLKFISWSCPGPGCTDRTTITIAHSDDDIRSHGLSTSFKFAPDGIPHIAYYYDYRFGDQQVRYVSYVGSGGNCGEGSELNKWQCVMVKYGPSVGQYPSLDFTPGGSPHIAFYDGNLLRLLVARHPTPGGNCGELIFRWLCEVVDAPVDADVGKYVSFVWNDGAYYAYYDQTNGDLKFYSRNLFNSPIVVDKMGWSGLSMGISMTIDKNGYPIIAYQKNDGLSKKLYVARPYLAFNDGQFGNCGDVPPGYLFLYWRCSPLDHAGQYLSEAEYVSLAVSSSGLAQIAYYELYYHYPVNIESSLKFISQRFPTFLPLLTKP